MPCYTTITLTKAKKWSGTSAVTAHGLCAEEHNITTKIVVSETGRRIPPETLESIFREFDSAPQLTPNQDQGPGLGT